jgi:hypothetical protein
VILFNIGQYIPSLVTLSNWSKIRACPKLVSNHGQGCHKDPHWEIGGLQRVMLDRTSPLYHAVYTQRTACERINSQAKRLGVERPRVRNGRSVANLNTLIYLVVNVRALAHAKSINQRLLCIPLLPLSDSPASYARLPTVPMDHVLK